MVLGNELTVEELEMIQAKQMEAIQPLPYDVMTNNDLKLLWSEEPTNHIHTSTAIIRDESTGIVKEVQTMEETQKEAQTLRQAATAFQPQETLNIADLPRVSVDVEIKEHVAKAGTEDEFKYKYVEVDGKKYRIPGVVIGDIKMMLEAKPNVKFVKVSKSGTGKATRYQVFDIE